MAFQIRVATDLCVTFEVECPEHMDLNTFIIHVGNSVHEQSTDSTLYLLLRFVKGKVTILQFPKQELRTLLELVTEGNVYMYVDAALASRTVTLCTLLRIPDGASIQTSTLWSML